MNAFVRNLFFGVATTVACLAEAGAVQAQILYSQNFDSLTRIDSVNERNGFPTVTRVATDPNSAPIPGVFSKTGPAGWQIDNTLGTYNGSPTIGNSGVPGAGQASFGVDEWEGWSFANKNFWSDVAGDQNRSQFTKGMNTVAVADDDEYFDLGSSDDPVNGGYYNSSLKTPAIAVATGNLYTFSFDSSWRPESLDDGYGPNAALNSTNNQAVEVIAEYNDPAGTKQQKLVWNSNAASPTFKAAATNETLSFNFGVPAGATSVKFHFNIANAADDWWWAVDNLAVTNLSLGGAGVWNENFDGVALGDSINERRATVPSHLTTAESTPNSVPRPDSFTNVPPAGWSIDNSALPAGTLGKNDIGVYEWEGWNFASLDFWKFADLQKREEFLKCVGNCAIADSDEWTDLGNPGAGGPMDTFMSTPAIDISGVAPGKLKLAFDSSWRFEDDQTAVITVDYNDGTGPHEVLRWESQKMIDDGMGGLVPNPFFHGDGTNESIALLLNNPSGATSAQFRFAFLHSNNNWWWAIDNVQVSSVPEPASCGLLVLAVIGVGGAWNRKRRS